MCRACLLLFVKPLAPCAAEATKCPPARRIGGNAQLGSRRGHCAGTVRSLQIECKDQEDRRMCGHAVNSAERRAGRRRCPQGWPVYRVIGVDGIIRPRIESRSVSEVKDSAARFKCGYWTGLKQRLPSKFPRRSRNCVWMMLTVIALSVWMLIRRGGPVPV